MQSRLQFDIDEQNNPIILFSVSIGLSDIPDVRDKVAKRFFEGLENTSSVVQVIFTDSEAGVHKGIMKPVGHPCTIDHPQVQESWKMGMVSFASYILHNRIGNAGDEINMDISVSDLEDWGQKQYEDYMKDLPISNPDATTGN
jgi:hypothetical protein